MRKFLFIILILFICNIIGFQYLLFISQQKKAYVFYENKEAFILQKKEILLDSIDDFVFDDYFMILSHNNKSYRYYFDDENLNVLINEKKYAYPYAIKEKQIETIEKIVYMEVYKEKTKEEIKNQTMPSSEEEEFEDEYFYLKKEELEFDQDTDISQIIKTISAQVQTNMKVSVDYSSLNPSQIGQYTVIFNTKNGNYSLIVKII